MLFLNFICYVSRTGDSTMIYKRMIIKTNLKIIKQINYEKLKNTLIKNSPIYKNRWIKSSSGTIILKY